MKPLNDKERTVAYFQFLVLAILFLVLWTVAIFFDYRVKAKDYQVIKAENKRLKENMILSNDLHLQIDSLIKVASELSKLSPVDFEFERKRFVDEISILWPARATDTTTLAKIKISVLKIFQEWSYSMAKAINVVDKNTALKAREEELKKLQESFNTLKNDFENYRLTHP